MARSDRGPLSGDRIKAAGAPHRAFGAYAIFGGSLPRARGGAAGAGTRERRIGWPGAPLAALVAVVAAAGAAWYGFLAHIHGHPAVRLAGALALASGGLAAVLLATPARQAAMPVPGAPGPLSQAARAAGTRTVAAILGLLSITTALIHFAVIDQHWAVYWLYGAFFILVGSAQLGWALAITAAPRRWLLWSGLAGNALVVITWIVTRTVGDLVGPAATTPERPGFGDLVATVTQVLVVVGCLILLSPRRVRASWWAEQARVIAALAVVPFLVLALYSAVGGSPFVSMVG